MTLISTTKISFGILFSVFCGVFACAQSVDDVGVVGARLRTIPLADLPTGASQPVGVTYDSAAGIVVAYDNGLLLHHRDQGWALLSAAAATGERRYADVASLGAGRYALPSIDDGYLLDLNQGTFESHFCYLPEPEEGEPVGGTEERDYYHLAQGLTYDKDSALLIATPDEFLRGAATPRATFFATYHEDGGGQPTHWSSAYRQTALGLAIDTRDGHDLWQLFENGATKEIAISMLDLGNLNLGLLADTVRHPFDISGKLEGMAIDSGAGELYILTRQDVHVFALP